MSREDVYETSHDYHHRTDTADSFEVAKLKSENAELRAAMQGVYNALGENRSTGTIGSLVWYRNEWNPAWERFLGALHRR